MTAPRPCLDCATVTRHGTRCPTCQTHRDRQRNQQRTHYHGDYRRRAAHVRATANADPTTRCWRCGNTAQPGNPWQAGHLTDSDPTSPLAAEHANCNATAGAHHGNARR